MHHNQSWECGDVLLALQVDAQFGRKLLIPRDELNAKWTISIMEE